MVGADNQHMKLNKQTKIGERISELIDACRLTARQASDDTGIPYAKFSKWKGDPADRPGIALSEAWTLACYFGARLPADPFKVLIYLADDSQPDGLVSGAVRQAWGERLEHVTAPELITLPTVAHRAGVPISKPKRQSRKRSRTDAKRKHLAG